MLKTLVQYVPFLLLPIQAWITQKLLDGFSSFLSQMKDYRSSNLLRKFQINKPISFFIISVWKKYDFLKRVKNDQIVYENCSIAAVHLTPFILNWNHWNFTQVLSMICYTSSKIFKAITTLSCEISKDVSMVVLSRISSILVPFPYIFRRV